MKNYGWVFLLVFAGSCGPKVVSFTAAPPRIGPRDSVHLSWQTRGVAAMSFHIKKVYVPPDSVDVWEYILTASRGGRVSAPSIRQVVVGAKRDVLALTLTGIEGDSVVYSAQKDTAYNGYLVMTMKAQEGDAVTVAHEGRTCDLSAGCMEGLNYAGDWVVKRKMTAAEAGDHHLIPGSYSLLTTISLK